MSKVTYKCVDCGKERTDKLSRFKKSETEYRCLKCAAIKRSKNSTWLKNMTNAIQKKYDEDEKYRNNVKQRMQNWSNNPIWRENQKLGSQNRSKNPLWVENVSKGISKKFVDDAEYKQTHDRIAKELAHNSDWINKQREGVKKRSDNTEWLSNVGIAARKRSNNQTWRENNKIGCQRRSKDPNYIKNLRDGHNTEEYKEWNTNHLNAARERLSDPFVRKKMSKSASERCQTEEFIELMSGESLWYGHHMLRKNGRSEYCPLWNEDLKRRIDAAYNYKSILSGKTRFENNNRRLTHHHLYWQEKACCIWDEDTQGYYAWILNNGKMVKYYIKEDPNKFVLLTDKEHGIVKGKKGTSKDRIYYIKLMEDLIEQRAKEGKKCYLTPGEYEIYKIEHADIIEKYKK